MYPNDPNCALYSNEKMKDQLIYLPKLDGGIDDSNFRNKRDFKDCEKYFDFRNDPSIFNKIWPFVKNNRGFDCIFFAFIKNKDSNEYEIAAFPFELKYSYKYEIEDPSDPAYITESAICKKFEKTKVSMAPYLSQIKPNNIFYSCIFARMLDRQKAQQIMMDKNVTNTMVMANWDGNDNFCLEYYGPCWSNLFSQNYKRKAKKQTI